LENKLLGSIKKKLNKARGDFKFLEDGNTEEDENIEIDQSHWKKVWWFEREGIDFELIFLEKMF
jgi:hypothetical protein